MCGTCLFLQLLEMKVSLLLMMHLLLLLVLVLLLLLVNVPSRWQPAQRRRSAPTAWNAVRVALSFINKQRIRQWKQLRHPDIGVCLQRHANWLSSMRPILRSEAKNATIEHPVSMMLVCHVCKAGTLGCD
jgi:hypothetical protein